MAEVEKSVNFYFLTANQKKFYKRFNHGGFVKSIIGDKSPSINMLCFVYWVAFKCCCFVAGSLRPQSF